MRGEEQERRAGVERYPVIPIQPAQFGKPREVGDRVEIARGMPGTAKPRDVRLEERMADRRMRIEGRFRMLVMVAMRACPPEAAALARLSTDQREQELRETARLVRPVREIAMVDALDREH